MDKLLKNWYLGLIVLLLLVVIAYPVSFNNDEKSNPEQTLQAIYMKRTRTAQASTVDLDATGKGEASFFEPEQQTVPGNSDSLEQTINELKRAESLY